MLGGVVLSMQYGIGMASDRTEVTIVPSVLVGLVRCDCSCQSRHAWLGSTPVPSRGYDGGEVVRPSSAVQLRQEEGSWQTLALAFGMVCLALLGFRRLGLC